MKKNTKGSQSSSRKNLTTMRQNHKDNSQKRCEKNFSTAKMRGD